MRINLATFLRLPAALIICVATNAAAQDRHPIMDRTYWLNIGFYYADQSITASLDSDILGENDPINFERDLDLSERDPLFLAEAGWQWGEKWSTALQYFETERTKSFVVDEEIEWEDLVFEVGIDARIGTGASVTRIIFERKMFENQNHQLNLALGFHWLTIDAFVEGEARLDDLSTEFRRSEAQTEAPLPNIGVSYHFSPHSRWAFTFDVDWLEASVGDISGAFMNANAGVNFRLFQNVGIGLDYRHLELDAKITDENWTGSLDTYYSGPTLAITGYW